MLLEVSQVYGQVQGMERFADLPGMAFGLEGECPFVLSSVAVPIWEDVGLDPLQGLCAPKQVEGSVGWTFRQTAISSDIV